MEYLIGVLILLTFICLAIYAARGGNLMMGMLIMALLWTFLSMIGYKFATNTQFIEANKEIINTTWIQAFAKVFQGGPEGWGTVLVNVVFGAWFGRVLLQTGIASTLIRKTTELGGDKPAITCVLLCAVTTVIFSSLFGAGAVVAIGVIVLPIFMALGIPKVLSVCSFMLSIGAGMFINPVLFGQYTAFFLDKNGKAIYTYETYIKWGAIALAVQLGFTMLLVVFSMRKGSVHAWAADRPVRQKRDYAPGISLLTPFIPVVLLIFFKIPIIFGFLTAGFFALFVCGKLKNFREACRVFNKDFFDGVVDTAPLVGFLLMVPMFNKAAELCIPYFNALLGGIVPNNTLIITIIFIVLAPLGLFRGPFTLFGCGAATLGILKGIGFSTLFLAPLMIASTTIMNVSCCITQSWVVWGIGYAKISTKDFMKMSVISGWIICAVIQIITYVMFG
ncbi:citrate transporter [Lacrimispora defluvii]|uniref:Citrate transporter n=1 Tax=Lacrimispora defluvii TaxID=2719233 RepID=A0ABX1VU02_9FIRM|nr:citrate transporter [Lacrimispora defluvii]NNJ30860.1 citrate transporter [Lacrimispora defluvii]